MGRRFYCEFCERFFRDNYAARKKHYKSKDHVERRNAYYSQFKDELDILNEELTKTPCYFFQKGFCRYGDECINSHLTVQKFEYLKAKVTSKLNDNRTNTTSPLMSVHCDDFATQQYVNEWLREQMIPQERDILSEELNIDFGQFPPSLIPPKIEDFNHALVDWGDC